MIVDGSGLRRWRSCVRVGLGAVLLGGSAACSGAGEAAQDGPGTGAGAGDGPGGRATPVSVRVADTGDLEVTLRASTTLRARAQVDVVPKQSGLVARILVEEGSRVQEGQLLAQLDDAEWRLQSEQAEARFRAAEDAVERGRALRAQQLIPEQEVERLVYDARAAEADRGLARLRVENAAVRSPIAGTVTHRYTERGQQVGAQSPVFSVADLDRLEAQVQVPERDAHRIVVGQVARILTQEGGPAAGEGRVERVRPVVDAASGTVQVTVTVADAGALERLRPGQFVNVDIVVETLPDRITLPRTAVLVDGSVPRVFVVRDGRAVEREVTLGHSRGDRVEIMTGLVPGDTVVVVGQDNLRADAAVRVMEVDGRPVGAGAEVGPDARAPAEGGR